MVWKGTGFASFPIILTVHVLWSKTGVLKGTHFGLFMLILACDGLGSWKKVLKWLIFALSSSPGLRTAPVHWSCLLIYVSDLRKIIGYDSFNARHGAGIVFVQYLYQTKSDTCLDVQWWFLSELVFLQQRIGGLEMNSLCSAWVSVWLFHDSPACHHCSTSVLSWIPWGIHLGVAVLI